MVGGWRRVFCPTIAKDREPKIAVNEQQQKQNNDDDDTNNNHPPSLKLTSRFAFFSNPSTHRLQSQPVVSITNLRCQTTPPVNSTVSAPVSPRLHCKTSRNSPRFFFRSNPSSPKSPSTFSILKTSLRLSKNRCGICLQSVKTGQGTAIFTAECSHGFHFPCIAAHVRKQGGLVCPVCGAHWKELPLLALRPNQKPEHQEEIKNQKKESVLKNLKVYNDDESLMSPTASCGFVSIPESDENEEEFQGFFVNTNNNSNTPISPVKLRHTRNVNVTLSPEAAVISGSRSYETYAVVLKVTAPPSPANKSLLISSNRAPIDLVTVIDVSRKMSGVKQSSMKRAMKLVISSLSVNDRLSIVAFSATSKRLFPLRRMTANGRRSARRIIDALGCIGQDSCAADAVKKAAKVLEDRRERNSVASILLLSDGQDNYISNSSSNHDRPSNIPVHTFHFTNETSAYDHTSPEDGFTKCFAKVLSVVVQDLRLELDFVTGSAHAQISAIYTCRTDQPVLIGKPGLIRFDNLYADEERELLLELKVPSSGIRSHHHVLSVQSSYKVPSSQKLVYGKEQALLVPRPQSLRSSSPNIQRLRFLYVITRALAESRQLIERNDLSDAHRMLSSARTLLIQSHSGLADEYLRCLEAEIATLNSHRQYQVQIQRPRSVETAAVSKNIGVYVDEKVELLTPTSAWKAAERLAKVAIMRKSLNRVSDLHGFENARF